MSSSRSPSWHLVLLRVGLMGVTATACAQNDSLFDKEYAKPLGAEEAPTVLPPEKEKPAWVFSDLEGYVAPVFMVTRQIAAVDRANRYGFRVEVGNYSRNVAVDFRFNPGFSYTDYGFSLKFFENWTLNSVETWGLSAGGGLVAMRAIGRSYDHNGVPFVDNGLSVFARITRVRLSWIALYGEFGVEAIPVRYYLGEKAVKESSFRIRPYFAVGSPLLWW